MVALRLMNGLTALVALVGTIGIIFTAFGLMLGILKPADAFKRLCVIVAMVIAVLVIPRIAIAQWMALTIWQQIGVFTLIVAACLFFGLIASKTKRSSVRRDH